MRAISPELFEDEFFGKLDPTQRLLWIGLILKVADDQGRFRDNAALIRSDVFPYDEISTHVIEDALLLFQHHGRIVRYSSGENGTRKGLVQIVNWWKFQKSASWMGASKFAPPPGWMDRYRFHGSKNEIIALNWDQQGGFLTSVLPSPLPSRGGMRDGDVNGDVNGDGEGEGEDKVAARVAPTTPQEWQPGPDAPAAAPVSHKAPGKPGDPVQIGTLLKTKPPRAETLDVSGYTHTTAEAVLGFMSAAPDVNPEILYTRVTGLATFPANIRADAMRILASICQAQRFELDAAVAYLKPFFDAYVQRKNKNGQPYSRTGLGWLEWALAGNVPQSATAKQSRKITFTCKPDCPVCHGTATTANGDPCSHATALVEAK